MTFFIQHLAVMSDQAQRLPEGGGRTFRTHFRSTILRNKFDP
jgi:hypothetical protein